jgi:CheY-like chemotaxis protein
MSGYEVARQLRQDPELARTLLVAVTGYGREEDRRRAREVGFDEHLIKPVEGDVLRELLADFRLPEEVWAGLHLPIDLAFFVHSTAAGRVIAWYPSPAGAMESLVSLEAWQALAEDNPVLRGLQPDVEALRAACTNCPSP